MRIGRRERRAVGAGDEGFALITVIATMAVLTLFVLASLAYATNTIAGSRRTQDWHSALAAAQAGIDDLVSRLNQCDGYWSEPCAGGPTQDDLTTDWDDPQWITVPTVDGTTDREFAYGFVTKPTEVTGLIRLRAKGRVRLGDGTYGPERTITADLRKPQFLNYVYYTDKESPAPRTIATLNATRRTKLDPEQVLDNGRTFTEFVHHGVESGQAQACGRYHYSTDPAAGARGLYGELLTGYYLNPDGTPAPTPREYVSIGGCDIRFADEDVIDGDLYSKDALVLSGTPTFTGKAQTYWQRTFNPPADPARPWRGDASDYPSPDGNPILVADRSIDLPPTNAAIRDQADVSKGGTGCLYQGPTSITLLTEGRMTVHSPFTTGATAACGGNLATPQTVALPPNGVVYVDSSTSACPAGKVLGRYPLEGEIRPSGDYSCTGGDAYVEGTLKGRLTIATAGDIYAVGDVLYEGGVQGGDVLGLVAQGYVKVWKPVSCDFDPGDYYCAKQFSLKRLYNTSDGRRIVQASEDLSHFVNMLPESEVVDQIHAAIVSVDNSFIVQNYDKGARLTQKLQVVGGIYQRHRGTVGTGGGAGGTGYDKQYIYDDRLKSLPPPYFLEPAAAPWQVVGFSEG